MQKYYPYIIVLLGAIFFIPNLGSVHLFDWDEINFAESAREMLLTDDYWRVKIDFKPFWEKPPLFFWLQVVSMKVFGINEFAARLPNALFGIITLLTLYLIGKKEKDATFGLLWALAYLGAFTPHFYFKSGIIDPVFNFFIFLGIYFSYRGIRVLRNKEERRKENGAGGRIDNGEISKSQNLRIKESKNLRIKELQNALIAGLFIGLAVLTKGPVGGLIWGLVVFFYWAIYARFKAIYSWKQIGLFFTICLSISSIWFAKELITNGLWFFSEFLTYQVRLFTTPEAGHGQPFYYHFVVVLIGCFPISILAIQKKLPSGAGGFLGILLITFWVVMILFSLSTTKIVHYSSMTYFSVAFFAANFLYNWLNNKTLWTRWRSFGLILIGFILSFVLFAVPFIGTNSAQIIPLIKDKFTVANLQAKVSWSGFEILIGIIYFIIILSIAFLAIRAAKFRQKLRIIIILFTSTATTLFLYGAFVIPKIERYTQGAIIDFYKSKQGQDVNVEVLGFKSYAHLFYFKKPIPDNKTKKKTYFITKIDRYEDYKNDSTYQFVEERNGFVVLENKKRE
jgi:4-amino-4-deoxy-L-arabinose transferase-like glycosyltransferase